MQIGHHASNWAIAQIGRHDIKALMISSFYLGYNAPFLDVVTILSVTHKLSLCIVKVLLCDNSNKIINSRDDANIVYKIQVMTLVTL